ncbi:MAG TPA: nucleotidyltransferase domain-containing protein [Tepidisphaeraceae bacterium]
MLALIERHRPQIEELCRRFGVKRLELFGSAMRGDFDAARSDLDFLVEFSPLGWKGSSDRYFGLLHGLEDLFGRNVDLVEILAAKNPHFVEVASRHRQVLYAA